MNKYLIFLFLFFIFSQQNIFAKEINGKARIVDGDTVEIRIAKADKAMYCAKKTGKNRYVFNQSDL